VIRAHGRVEDVHEGTLTLRVWWRGDAHLIFGVTPREWTMRGRRSERRVPEVGLPVDVAIRANTISVRVGRRREDAEHFAILRRAREALGW
jgi:hypothetical protein